MQLKHTFRTLLLAALLASAATGCTTTPTTTTTTPSAVIAESPLSTTSVTSTQAPATADSHIDQARTTLTDFFAALHGQRYIEAIQLHGGSYDLLLGYNPTVSPDDHAKLLENGCTTNGLQCLEIREIVKAEAVSPSEFSFIVEFNTEDGSLFELNTSQDQPAQRQWTYTVKRVEDRFLVQELPVYMQ